MINALPRNPLEKLAELPKRERIGVEDFVLLDDFENEESFVENLQIRFEKNLIYTYIGQVLISVNPFKQLPLYHQNAAPEYRKKHFYEVQPHIFAIAENAFQSIVEENTAQCILISGESGSGKTEASKQVLQYIALASRHLNIFETNKEKLLKSNPVLEAFGNAKTNRNDNSSRFGKYMGIQFDFRGSPVGGNILNFLLEKSRVVNQSNGERNFHIFYQLLAGLNDDEIKRMHLDRNLSSYRYLTNKDECFNSKRDDQSDFKMVQQALIVVDFSSDVQNEIFDVIASLLHIGNINFIEEDGEANIVKNETVDIIAKLIGCNADELCRSMVRRTIDAHGDIVKSPLLREMAIYARDALAKAIYERLFSWLVSRINLSLKTKDYKLDEKSTLGILDIYGFEIFKNNSFEQFCINFCNEKLQHLFIELTLKSEQQEYQREGIEWIPVNYFDNKVICNLIEEKHEGIIAILDEECLRPGLPDDLTFLEKLKAKFFNHPHYICHSSAPIKVQKEMDRNEFRLIHYAGSVNYNVLGFIDKNRDLLFRDLKESMNKATNFVISACFSNDEYKNKKRPATAITNFKNSLNSLMDILMCKEPSYVRCIKPNQFQLEGVFDKDLVSHQVKYLGLMENLRVRRAGFAFRRTYEIFLQRYKCLSKSTWPNFQGPPKYGVETLIKDLKYNSEEYRMGRTKIFIRFPKTLFDTEDALQIKKNEIAAIIQSHWKGRKQRIFYLEQRDKIVRLQSYCRRYLAIQTMKRRNLATKKIRSFIKGFITRNDPPNGFNEKFLVNSKRMWLIRLSKELPLNLLKTSWPPAPTHCTEASKLIQHLHKLHLAKVFREQLSFEKKRQLQLKVNAEKIFKGNKSNYYDSVPFWFNNNRIPKDDCNNIKDFVASSFHGENLVYASPCIKFDRHGYKPRERFILLSNVAIYLLDGKSYQQKHKILLEKVDFALSNRSDNLILVQIPIDMKNDKGDLILEMPYLIEFSSFIVDTTKRLDVLHILERPLLKHNMLNGKSGLIDFQIGTKPGIIRNKNGHLTVITVK